MSRVILLILVPKLGSDHYPFEIPAIDVELCCSAWFGGCYLFFEGMSEEQFLFPFEEVMASCHKRSQHPTGGAQVLSWGFQQDD